jgi:hypothetical protein
MIHRATSSLAICIFLLLGLHPVALHAEEAAATEKRLASTAKLLSSDAMEGRGIGTKGLEKSAEFIARSLADLGLKTKLFDGSPRQKFEVTTKSELGPKSQNHLTFVGPPKKEGGPPTKIKLKLNQDFNPLAVGGSGKFDLPVVLVGYGITAKKEKYDDYAGIDVQGKAVVIIRHEPQQGNAHSVFNGTKTSSYAPFRRKISNAYEHGAAAIIFCTSEFETKRLQASIRRRWQVAVDSLAEGNTKFKLIRKPTMMQKEEHFKAISRFAEDVRRYGKQLKKEADPVLGFERAGPGESGRSFPVMHCTRSALNQMLTASNGKSLKQVEKAIDEGPTPKSRVLKNWRIVGETLVKRKKADVYNIVAVLEGEGPKADETVVIGAHYDHLGRGGASSAAHGSTEIHNGADDNASGTTALLEVAWQLAKRQKKLPRRIVFIAFTGEERGLLGSSHYVRKPLFPLDKTVAMLNMDMVGRLKDNKLVVHGTGTAKGFKKLIDTMAKRGGFKITHNPGGNGPSDHASFYGKKIPVLHFFTGSHKDYHRPSDDFDKLNIKGIRRIASLVADAAVKIAESDARPEYVAVKSKVKRRGGSRPYFGSRPDFTVGAKGYAISGVSTDSPAERAGLKGGDVIVQFGKSKVGNLEDFDSALRKFKAGDKVPVTVLRKGKRVTLQVVLDPPR